MENKPILDFEKADFISTYRGVGLVGRNLKDLDYRSIIIIFYNNKNL